jgi:hypothetical protein
MTQYIHDIHNILQGDVIFCGSFANHYLIGTSLPTKDLDVLVSNTEKGLMLGDLGTISITDSALELFDIKNRLILIGERVYVDIFVPNSETPYQEVDFEGTTVKIPTFDYNKQFYINHLQRIGEYSGTMAPGYTNKIQNILDTYNNQ